MSKYRIEQLAKSHDRKDFNCGVPELDDYFKRRVRQDVRRRFASCYVIIETASGSLAGFYTLSAASVAVTDLPTILTAKLPRYPSVPVVRLGRLAVATSQQGRKIGSLLLVDALRRAVASEIAVYAIVVDAKNNKAKEFYEHHGFLDLGQSSNSLFLPLQHAIRDLLSC